MTKTGLVFMLLLLTNFCSAQTTWKTVDHKNGFHLQIPSYFKKGLLVAAGTLQYYDNTLDKSIVTSVESFGEGTEAALQKEYKDDLKNYTATYSTIKPTWFVISGTDKEGVFYLKTIIAHGQAHRLRLTYPKEKQQQVDQFLATMAASFH